jgi:hypothetical protein
VYCGHISSYCCYVGLEEKKQSENIEEFVAMVTFGYKTKIVTHPAKHYTQLHKDFSKSAENYQ